MKNNPKKFVDITLIQDNTNNYMDVFIKGKKMKKIYQTKQQDLGYVYDVAYLDLVNKTAFGQCQEWTCPEELKNKTFLLSFRNEKIITPFDLLNFSEAKITGSVMVENRETIIVEVPEGDKKKKLYLDEFYGLPLKYELYQNKTLLTRVEFRRMVFNSVRDEEFLLG